MAQVKSILLSHSWLRKHRYVRVLDKFLFCKEHLCTAFPSSYEDLMFGEDEEEERPGIKAKKKVKIPTFPNTSATDMFLY